MAPPQVVPLARRTKSHGTLSPAEWAQIIAEEARAMGVKMTPKQIAEGVGVIFAESSGNADNLVQGPSGHIGAWAEGTEGFPSSAKERLDPRTSTQAAIKDWAANGKSWWPAWGRWEAEQSGQSGTTQWKKYIAFAEHALGGVGAGPRASSPEARKNASEPGPSSSSFGGDLMHLGLVGVLVIGGVAMVGMGTTRLLGTTHKPEGQA